jgi:hypothetical protein
LIQSVNTFYKEILDHQKEASSQEKLIRDLVQHINLSISDFMAWKKKDGSTSLAEKVDGSLLKTADMIDKIKKTYGL